MCAYAISWDETSPADHTTFQSQPGAVRNDKTAVRERLQFGGAYWPSTHDELAGEYSYIRMANNASPPAAVTGKWHLYVDASGLHIKDPSGTVTDIASDSVQAKTGDWMMSSVTTARTGWTNVSATYSNKFMRINATPLTTGGADTHTTPSHVLTTTEMPSHAHQYRASSAGGAPGQAQYGNSNDASLITEVAGGGSGHTHGAADNVPSFVQICIFQKN